MSAQHFVISDRPPGLHIVTAGAFQDWKPVSTMTFTQPSRQSRHDRRAAQPLTQHTAGGRSRRPAPAERGQANGSQHTVRRRPRLPVSAASSCPGRTSRWHAGSRAAAQRATRRPACDPRLAAIPRGGVWSMPIAARTGAAQRSCPDPGSGPSPHLVGAGLPRTGPVLTTRSDRGPAARVRRPRGDPLARHEVCTPVVLSLTGRRGHSSWMSNGRYRSCMPDRGPAPSSRQRSGSAGPRSNWRVRAGLMATRNFPRDGRPPGTPRAGVAC